MRRLWVDFLVARLTVAPIRTVRVVTQGLQSTEDIELRRAICLSQLLQLAADLGERFYGWQWLWRAQRLTETALVQVETLDATGLVAGLTLAG